MFTNDQIEFMQFIRILVDFDNVSDENCVLIEDKVSDYLEEEAYEEDRITEEARMCYSILDMDF